MDKGLGSLLHAYGHDEEWDSGLMEAPLHGECRVIEQQAREERVLGKDDLTAEEYGGWVFLVERTGKTAYFFRHIGADRGESLSVESFRLQEPHVPVQIGVNVRTQLLQSLGALESIRVDDSGLDEKPVAEAVAENLAHVKSVCNPFR